MKFDVEKHIVIDAPLTQVRGLVEDFQHWNSWSPWTILEPECKVSVSGTAKSPGHEMTWDGELVGAGTNTLKHYDEKRIDYSLVFLKPFKSKADVSFLFEDLGGKTKVTWLMHSSMPFFLFFMVKTMKNWVGMDYERGLRMLKEIAEKGKLNCQTLNNGTVDYTGFSYVGIKRTLPMADLAEVMAKDFEKIVNDIVINGQKGAEHWVCLYPEFDLKKMQATYIAAVSDEDVTDLDLDDSYIRGKIESSKALEIKHDGAYDFLGNAWSMGMMLMRAKKLKGNGYPFEQYWNSPLETPPDELRTSIYFPHK